MAINKNFPNYSKAKLHSKVISHSAGLNRQERRSRAARERKSASWNMSLEKRMLNDAASKARAKRVEKRVHRATTRRMEREAAKAKGVPVKYSIA